MPLTNREAYELKKTGRAVIVICAGCGEQVWTDDSVYVEGRDEWYCPDCNKQLMDDMVEEMVGDEDEVMEKVEEELLGPHVEDDAK